MIVMEKKDLFKIIGLFAAAAGLFGTLAKAYVDKSMEAHANLTAHKIGQQWMVAQQQTLTEIKESQVMIRTILEREHP